MGGAIPLLFPLPRSLSLPLPSFPLPLPNPLGSLGSAVSKRMCNIVSPEHAFGDNRTVSIYASRQK